MPSASAYLDQFADFLEQQLAPFAAGPDILTTPTDEDATLWGVIVLPDGCQVHINLAVDCHRIGVDEWALYSFHCQDRNAVPVVRFDSFPHHWRLPTHPHHVHRGPQELVAAHPRPTGREVVAEILSYHQGHRRPPGAT